MTGPLTRITLRYGVGIVFGMEMATDPDVMAVVALLVGAAVEIVYGIAKKNGWAT